MRQTLVTRYRATLHDALQLLGIHQCVVDELHMLCTCLVTSCIGLVEVDHPIGDSPAALRSIAGGQGADTRRTVS